MAVHQIRVAITTYLLFTLTAAPALARDILVDNVAGSDMKSGRRPDAAAGDGPVRTLDRALRLVRRGDRIVLANTGEPYREMISLCDVGQRGYADLPLVIQGNGATLDGTVTAAPGAWKYENDNIFSFRPRRLTYQQLFRDGQPLRRVQSINYAGATLPIEPLEWALLTDRIAFRVEEGKLPEQYALRHAGLQTGITLYNTEYIRIENLVIQGFQQDGINAHELVRQCELVNVECRANGRSGISVGGVSRVNIVNSNCYDNGRAQLRVEGQGSVTASGCEFGKNSTDVPWLELRGGRAVVDGVPYGAAKP
jgi:hypothetical protein